MSTKMIPAEWRTCNTIAFSGWLFLDVTLASRSVSSHATRSRMSPAGIARCGWVLRMVLLRIPNPKRPKTDRSTIWSTDSGFPALVDSHLRSNSRMLQARLIAGSKFPLSTFVGWGRGLGGFKAHLCPGPTCLSDAPEPKDLHLGRVMLRYSDPPKWVGRCPFEANQKGVPTKKKQTLV